MKNQTALFFCENCNSEVGRDDKVCARCGHFFASVRCPQCDMMGDPSQFRTGCPQCGYAMDLSSFGIPSNNGGKKKKKSSSSKGAIRKEEHLPMWLYIIPFLVLIGAFIGVFFYISKM